MKNKIIKSMLLIVGISLVFYAVHTFALMRASGSVNGSINTSTWSVTRNNSQSGDSINVYKGGATDSYTLTVQSNSQVDVLYKIIISNLPSGVEVDIDNTGYLTPTASGTLTIENANTVINYGDSTKTKTHILTFRATNGAQLVTNQKIDIDVEFRQGI